MHHDEQDPQSTRCRFPDVVTEDVLNGNSGSETKQPRRSRAAPKSLSQLFALQDSPWFGWVFVYTYVLLLFSASRFVVLKSLVMMYGRLEDYTFGVITASMTLGFLEDIVCATYFVSALWLFDTSKRSVLGQKTGDIVMFTGSWLLFFAMMGPFAADVLLVLNRDMRFTFEVVAAMIRERDHLKKAPLEPEELTRTYMTVVVLVLEVTLFAIVRTRACWADLTLWNPTLLSFNGGGWRQRIVMVSGKKAVNVVRYEELALEDGIGDADSSGNDSKRGYSVKKFLFQDMASQRGFIIAILGLGLIPALVVAVTWVSAPLVAYSALNTPLNELFGHALEPTMKDGTLENMKVVETFIHPTELHKLFAGDSLYRRTTGFQGDLAFDVNISTDNPPNVIVIGIESFRYQDSRYLVGEDDPSNLFDGVNITITPNFDRWAKRGIALRNMWSSLPTSRSVESLLFAQVPYDSTVKTGTSGGWTDTKLYGLPQFFTAKGYETFFSTGCGVTFDGWDSFFSAHGYDTVWSNVNMIELAERELGITHDQWFGPEHRGFQWGVHDDISFKFLGDLLMNKTRQQSERMTNGEDKQPLFLTHYTISSHVPFDSWPTWYEEMEKPDFSALYEGKKHADAIKRYLEVRYFTDMELGRFMDRMSAEGVLNDTIVVIVGDHGQAPEADLWNIHEDSVRRVASTIVAEGRLGDAVGLVIDDAVEQYDILNTLADITGVPEGGFVQHGVGRSLKRKIPFGERVVFANDPGYKMSIVRGHKRLRYDAVMDSMFVHDTETDHYITADLYPDLSPDEQEEWKSWRGNGRKITAYYKQRWEDKCFSISCG